MTRGGLSVLASRIASWYGGGTSLALESGLRTTPCMRCKAISGAPLLAPPTLAPSIWSAVELAELSRTFVFALPFLQSHQQSSASSAAPPNTPTTTPTIMPTFGLPCSGTGVKVGMLGSGVPVGFSALNSLCGVVGCWRTGKGIE